MTDISKISNEAIKERFNRFKELLGKSTEQIAQETGVEISQLQSFPKQNEECYFFILQQLNEIYGLSVNWLLMGELPIIMRKGSHISNALYMFRKTFDPGDKNYRLQCEFFRYLENQSVERAILDKLGMDKIEFNDEKEEFNPGKGTHKKLPEIKRK